MLFDTGSLSASLPTSHPPSVCMYVCLSVCLSVRLSCGHFRRHLNPADNMTAINRSDTGALDSRRTPRTHPLRKTGFISLPRSVTLLPSSISSAGWMGDCCLFFLPSSAFLSPLGQAAFSCLDSPVGRLCLLPSSCIGGVEKQRQVKLFCLPLCQDVQ